MIATRSPSLTLVTSGPVATTSPENSCPRIWGFCAPVSGCGATGVTIGPAMYSCRSVPQIPHEATLTVTCPGPGPGGSATSSMRRSRTPWNRSARTATSWPARRPSCSRHDPLGAQAIEEIGERGLGVADAEEAEAPALPHVGEGLDRPPEVDVGVPPRRERVDGQVAQAVTVD